LRLAYVANPYSIHTQRWMRYFIGRGHEVHLIGVSPTRKPLVPSTMPSGVVLYDLATQINVRKLRYLVWGFATRRIVHRIQPDILHAHQVAGDGWVGAATGFHPFVVTAWGSDLLVGPERSWIQRQLARWVLRRADYVTCVSKSLAQVARPLGIDPRHLEVVPWGVDTDIFHPISDFDKATLRARLGLGSGPIVLSMRAVQSLYNPLDIARSIARVLEQVPAAHFIIRTYDYDQGLLNRFQTIVRKCHATDAVRYVGELPDDHSIADLYRAADVAVSVPSSDGTPLSVLEALACGLVPVLSDVSSLHEWIVHEHEGLFVPVGDVKAISAAIVRLIKESALRSELRLNGARLIRQRGDSRVWMRRSEEIYQHLLESPLPTQERAF
jgi:glycosyltransferase involved in cell wall biosynthesis